MRIRSYYLKFQECLGGSHLGISSGCNLWESVIGCFLKITTYNEMDLKLNILSIGHYLDIFCIYENMYRISY